MWFPVSQASPPQDPSQKTTGGLLPFAPQDRMAMHQSYMPFFRFGGLFVPTPRKFALGEDVFVLIKFPDADADRVPAVGKVVWINRSGSTSKPAGIGVQFSDVPENVGVRDAIEKLIAGLPGDAPTHTM